MKNKYLNLLLLVLGILGVFLFSFFVSGRFVPLHTFNLFNTLTVLGAIVVLAKSHSLLHRMDWLVSLVLGVVVFVGMFFATLFSPYSYFGLIGSNPEQAIIRGLFTSVSMLAGLVIMRKGGPVQFNIANGCWRRAGKGALIGLAVGIPLAILNVFALAFTQGHSIVWQNPLAASLDALQPGIVEEVIYRFALWGMFWLALRKKMPESSIWISGLLSMVVHNYSHFDELFIQSPLLALGMGTVLALFWGIPELILARRQGLESSIAFHWIQDAVRFVTGY